MTASSAHHGSPTFWWAMVGIGCAELLVVAVLVYRERGRPDTARYRRYVQGFWGFAGWTALCLARLTLLHR